MTSRIFIDGAAGTTGLEIRDRLKDRAEFELIVLDDAQRKDEAARREALHEADVAILCLPDDAAREAVALAAGSDTRIIDASSAHRVAEGWTYGFPELIGHDKVANAQFVSNPGCYPTGFLALVAPLVEDGLIPSDFQIYVVGMSGYSGGGKSLIDRFEKDPSISYRAYGLELAHKHVPEMMKYANLSLRPHFAPSVIRAYRGMIVDVPLTSGNRGASFKCEDVRNSLFKKYDNSKVIRVRPNTDAPKEILIEQDAPAWDGLEIFTYFTDEDQNTPEAPDVFGARLIARLDNLGKGASGAAIQNLNIMCGLPETTGLRL